MMHGYGFKGSRVRGFKWFRKTVEHLKW